MTDALALPVVDCWNDIGVNGDRSCPKLKAAIHCQNCDVFADAARTFLDRPAPAGYLGEVTESLALPDEQRVAGTISALVFGIGDQLFGIDTKAVVEVTSPRVAHRVGHRSGRIFAGIVNIHGQLELCCSLAGLLQIDGSAGSPGGAGARMLLVELDGLRWSFEVSIVHGVQRFEATDVAPVPAASQHGAIAYLLHVFRFGDRHVGYLDLETTFQALEASVR